MGYDRINDYNELKKQHGWQDNLEYFKDLKDKKVILVGPAEYLVGSGLGGKIDKYDIIVRMNLSSPVPENLYCDIGSRTDVLYHILIRKRHLQERPDLFSPHTKAQIKDWKNDGVKWVVLKNNLKILEKGSADINSFLTSINGIINWTNVPGYDYRKLTAQTRSGPNMGTIAVYHLLKSKLKSLYMVGCDFHQTGYYTGYGGFNETQAKLGAGGDALWGQKNNRRDRRIHSLTGQLEYLRYLKQMDERFTTDKVMSEILGEE